MESSPDGLKRENSSVMQIIDSMKKVRSQDSASEPTAAKQT
jgi:hypothetical protein